MKIEIPIRDSLERNSAVMENNPDFFDWIREMQRSEQPKVDILKEFFGRLTPDIIEFAEKEVELARAMQDHESLVKVQIKMEIVYHILGTLVTI